MAVLTLTVSPEQAGCTVLSLLKTELRLSSGCIHRLKRQDAGITLNGTRVFTTAVVQTGDVLAADVSSVERPSQIRPIPMDLDIYFEDEHLLILDKPAPLATIPSSLVPDEPTLANGIAHYLGPEAGFHPVNRLDRGTTGLMVVAKTGCIHERLQRSLHSGSFFREYLAVTLGVPDPPVGEIHLAIGRAEGSAIKRCIDPAGREAHTEYRVLESRGGLALVELHPLTGRTHQLRVHMASMGCPLAGDWLYGVEDPELIPRPALHGARLALEHPITGERLDLRAPLPPDMTKLLER